MPMAVKSCRHVGVAQIYPWRPHAQHRDFLLDLAREHGLETSELSCLGSLVKCYDKRHGSLAFGSLDNCLKCRIGRLPSARSHRQFHLDWSYRHEPIEGESDAIRSNQASLLRAEIESDLEGDRAFDDLIAGYRVGYRSTLDWIENQGVDLILLFNGRMDITRGVMDAAIERGVDFMSYERTWFGDGIQMLPFENCLGLRSTLEACREIANIELADEDRARAERIIDRRVRREGSTEWRDFQSDPSKVADIDALPLKNDFVLVLPSSSYEFWGHADWRNEWNDNFEALDHIQERLGIPWKNFVIRGHPVWAQKVGRAFGHKTDAHYREFCRLRGAHYVPATSNVATPKLIENCSLVLLNGGSAVIEAIWRGKPVISLAKSKYMASGVCPTVFNSDVPIDIPEDGIRRDRIVKFVHAMDRVVPTFVPYLQATSSAEQAWFEGADFEMVLAQVRKRTVMIPGKNDGVPGKEIERPDTLVQRVRSLAKIGDR